MAILPVAAVFLALPAIGLAGLPDPSDATIKVPTTIGGVSLGMKQGLEGREGLPEGPEERR